MTGPPIVSRNLPASSFPFTVEWIAEATKQVVHSVTVDGPGVLTVPALEPIHGPCIARVSYADGSVVEAATDGTTRRVE